MQAIIVDDPNGRELSLLCDHGELVVYDTGPAWSQRQLEDFATAVLTAKTHCDCFGERSWLPPKPPAHVRCEQVRVYAQELELPDPDVETQRPEAIPPTAVSLAASRYFESHTPSPEHSLEADYRLVRWWWTRRQAGLLRDD